MLSVLNEEQREAVVHEGAPLLILAGAGSGKTRVITTKIAYLIAEKNVNPWQILAVTFTKKAANEMKERAIQLDERCASTQIKTFHSFGAWFLRMNANKIGISENFTVYDDDDTISLIQKTMPTLTKQRASHYAHLISLAKDYCYAPDDLNLKEIDDDPQFPTVYQNYQNRLKESGNVDFGDLIMLPYLILKNHDELRHYMQNRFKVIMVDEYQDSNVAQFLLLQELSGVKENSKTYVCVVGDDDQSIYKFRGAEVENILNFENQFPGTKIIRLEKNYRSTAEILQIADDVVSKNKERLGKTLISVRGKGKLPALAFLNNQDEEANECVSLIKKAAKNGTPYSDWAVLYRTNAQSLTFETFFMQNKIPYEVVGSLKFYEREEVKDLLAYISLLANPRNEIAFRRVINKPARGIGGTTQDKIVENARTSLLYDAETGITSNPIDYVESTRQLSSTFSKKAKEGAIKFCQIIDELKKTLGIKIEINEENQTENLKQDENDLFFDFDEPKEEKIDFKIDENSENFTITTSQQIEPMKLAEKLSLAGYYRVSKVSAIGEFSINGEVFDIFAINEKNPFRINFIFDEIKTIKNIKLEDKSIICNLDSVSIFSMKNPQKTEEKNENKNKTKKTERTGNLSDLINDIIEKSGLKEHFEAEDEIDGTQKVENMQELMNSAVPFSCTLSGLQEFLDHIQLDNTTSEDENNSDEIKNKVTLITIHNTKGLEFNRVILTGMEHGIFPKIDKVGEELEEERRLCYVGMTRAKNSLFMTCCASRRMYGRIEYLDISPFLREIKPEHINIVCSKGQEQRKRQITAKVYGKNGLSNPKSNSISEKYCKGTRIYHDEYGYGEIFKTETTNAGEYKVSIRFENGEVKNFLPKYSSYALQIIKD